ncbi:hypothetical protein ACFU7Y_15670 [Kitasatospora sp. NPDC057542]|uniref:hypothetical protein n=1 Tax=Kitasatospora sp. NPDC057542 TaxID=3346162 RepID=UPI0036AF2701
MTDPRQPVTGRAYSPAQGVTLSEGIYLGDASLSGNGAWTWTPTKDWTGGSHTVAATAWYRVPLDDGWGFVDSSPRYVTFDVALPLRSAPVISAPVEGSTVTDARQAVVGTTDPGVEKVTLADGNTPLPGQAVVTGTTWTYTPTTDWTPGLHTMTATAHRSGLDSPASAPRHFTMKTTGDTGDNLSFDADPADTLHIEHAGMAPVTIPGGRSGRLDNITTDWSYGVFVTPVQSQDSSGWIVFTRTGECLDVDTGRTLLPKDLTVTRDPGDANTFTFRFRPTT